MVSFESYILKQQYKKVAAPGDRFSLVDDIINWYPFQKIVAGIYDKTSPRGEGPNTDPAVRIKLLLLQAWYGLSDQELEYQSTTLRLHPLSGISRQGTRLLHRLAIPRAPRQGGKGPRDLGRAVAPARRPRPVGLKGVMQNATFITADLGHARADKPLGEEAQTRRNKEGT